MASSRLILVTGATGKVGQTFMRRLLADPARADDRIRALCHNRLLPATDRVDVLSGSIADRAVVAAVLSLALAGRAFAEAQQENPLFVQARALADQVASSSLADDQKAGFAQRFAALRITAPNVRALPAEVAEPRRKAI